MEIAQLLTGVASQGTGWALAVILAFALYFMYRENKQLSRDKVDLANQRVEDLKESQKAYNVLSESATKVAENTYTIVQNLQQLLNNAKKL